MAEILQMTAGAVLVLALLDACRSDLAAFRIPNRCSLMIACAFLVAALAGGMPLEGVALALAAGAAVFAGGAALFALKVWGGGDVKLAAAVALWTGFGGLPRFLLVMALAGGVLAVAVLALRRLRPEARLASAGHLPYGLAIAAGGIDFWLGRGVL